MKEYLANIDLHQHDIYSSHLASEDVIDFHTHLSHQLTFLIGGTTYLITQQNSYLIPAYHFVWIPAQLSHKFIHRKTNVLSVHNIYIPKHQEMTDPFYEKIGIYPAPAILIDILKYTDNNIITKDSKEYNFIESFILLLPKFCNQPFNTMLPLSNQKKVADILRYVLYNLEMDLSLKIVSDRFYMSERTLSRTFQEQLKMSFHKYVKQARIIKAIELLLDKDLNIGQIADRVGYKSIAAFSNAFTKMTSMRPTDFTKTIQ